MNEKNPYEKMTQEEFGDILADLLSEMSGLQLFTDVIEIQSDVIEGLNNEVLSRWESHNKMLDKWEADQESAEEVKE